MTHDELFVAIKAGDAARVAALLATAPGLAGARNTQGMSAVLTAIYHQQPAIVAMLLAAGPTLSFYEAAAAGVVARATELLDGDPQLLNRPAPDGFSALGLASFFGHAELAALLLERGADPNLSAANPMRVAPLHSAAAGQHLEIARMLLDHGAAVNARQEGDLTPLHAAAENGQRDMVELLLERGADPTLRSTTGASARDLALGAGHAGIAELL